VKLLTTPIRQNSARIDSTIAPRLKTLTTTAIAASGKTINQAVRARISIVWNAGYFPVFCITMRPKIAEIRANIDKPG
jgi:hypothetical protein